MTPGPWTVWCQRWIGPKGGPAVAEVTYRPDDPETEAANVRAISKVPEMIELLREQVAPVTTVGRYSKWEDKVRNLLKEIDDDT